MSIVSHLHHLFNAETCQSYIHTLRWKDRPLQCPRCQSHNVGPWGTYHYQPGLKRYRCREKDCKRTFNDLTGTLLDGSKRSLRHWILATFLLCLSCSSRRIAREVGVHIRTGYRWCWWLRNAALSYEMRSSVGQGRSKPMTSITLPARRAKPRRVARSRWDAAHVDAARNASPGGAITTKIGRPLSPGSVARGLSCLQATRDFTVKTVQKAADLAVQRGSRLYTDSASSYRALTGYLHAYVNHTQKEYARGDVHENRAECLFSLLKPYLRVFRGVSKTNLPGYVGFFQFLRNFYQLTAFEQAEMILYAALDPAIASKARKGDFVRCLDHFDLLQSPIN